MSDATTVNDGAAAGESVAPRRLPATLLRSIAFKFSIYGLNAATGIVTARTLNPSGRGELAAMILWPALLAGVTTLGLPSALVYHVRRAPERTAELVGSAMLISLLTGLAATIVGWFLVPLWLREQPESVVRTAQYCLLITIIYSLVVATRAAWEAQGRFDSSNLIQAMPPLVTLAALIPLAAMGILTTRAAAATYVLAGLPTAVWSVSSVLRANRPTFLKTHGAWRQLMHYGARSYGAELCGVLALYVDQALVVGLLRPQAMGLYVVGLNLARVINAIHGSVALLAFPRMVGLDPSGVRVAIARAARLSALVSGAMGLLVIAVGGVLVTALYGPSFQDTARILPIFVAEVILAGLAQVLVQGFLASGRPGVTTLVQVSGLLLSVPLFLVLVPPFGLTGAAGALLLSTGLRLVLTLLAYPLFLGVPVPRIWIGVSDIVDLGAYRAAFRQSLARASAGGGK